MELSRKNGLTIGHFPAVRILAPGLECVFTTRLGGKSPPPFDSLNLGLALGDSDSLVMENRSALLNLLDIDPKSLAFAEQVHGKGVKIVKKPGIYAACDGLATDRKGITLAIKTADCYPLIIFSPPEKAIAALHVGRGGAAGGIIKEALGILLSVFRIMPESAISLIGPGICSRCYRIDERIASEFPSEVIKRRNGHPYLDLLLSIKNQLMDRGIRKRNIFDTGFCTSCRNDLFFSYRRDGGETGRQWTIARIV